MELYAIRRREAWKTEADVQDAGARSGRVGNEEMSDDVRWIRTYVIREEDGTLGSICIYEATSPGVIGTHAQRSEMPADEIYPVVDTFVIRPDPVAAAA
jgi:hypothetical protein